MSNLDPAVEFPKLTDKHRIVYRPGDAPESVESVETGLYETVYGVLRTMTGVTIRWAGGSENSSWMGAGALLILEAVIQPVLTPYKGMQLVTKAGRLWTYWPFDNHTPGTTDSFSSDGEWESWDDLEPLLRAGELTIFTPEVPA